MLYEVITRVGTEKWEKGHSFHQYHKPAGTATKQGYPNSQQANEQ